MIGEEKSHERGGKARERSSAASVTCGLIQVPLALSFFLKKEKKKKKRFSLLPFFFSFESFLGRHYGDEIYSSRLIISKSLSKYQNNENLV